jgi:hypothetical protein
MMGDFIICQSSQVFLQTATQSEHQIGISTVVGLNRSHDHFLNLKSNLKN